MDKKTLKFLASTICNLLLLAGCDTKQALTPTQVPQGNCVGRVSDGNGAPVEGASVFLVAEGYSPLPSANRSGNIYSTVSDASGQFGFEVEKNGSYNLLASGNNRFALRKSIGISTGARVELSEEKLLAPGSLSGTVQLQSTTDHRSAVVLFGGTNIFTQPSDSAGNYSVPALAQGTYKLRFLSMESGFAVVETTVTITSGNATSLPTVVVPKKYTPRIDSFSVVYDPLMMKVNLSWISRDTAYIDSFAIYCNREKNLLPPVLTVGKTVTSATIDIILAPEDTFTYQIAAIGKDGWEGVATGGKPFIKWSALSFNVALDKSIFAPFRSGFYFRNNCTYVINNDKSSEPLTISKYDSNSVLLTTYKNIGLTSGSAIFNSGSNSFDESGNHYMLLRDSTFTTMIVKFDPDLNVTRRLVLASPAGPSFYSFAVSSTGSILLYRSGRSIGWHPDSTHPDTTYITKYDPEFNIIAESVITDILEIREAAAFGDTTIALISSKAQGESASRIFYFDPAFNTIGTTSDFSQLDKDSPSGYVRSNYLQICSNNLFIGGYYADPQPSPGGSDAVLCLFNQNNEVVARSPYEGWIGSNSQDELFSDYRGHLFLYDGEDGIVRCSVGDILSLGKR